MLLQQLQLLAATLVVDIIVIHVQLVDAVSSCSSLILDIVLPLLDNYAALSLTAKHSV